MYAKIFNRLFYNNYALKKRVSADEWDIILKGDSSFRVKIRKDVDRRFNLSELDNQFFVIVHEAELAGLESISVEERVHINRKFYEALQRCMDELSFLDRKDQSTKEATQLGICNYENASAYSNCSLKKHKSGFQKFTQLKGKNSFRAKAQPAIETVQLGLF